MKFLINKKQLRIISEHIISEQIKELEGLPISEKNLQELFNAYLKASVNVRPDNFPSDMDRVTIDDIDANSVIEAYKEVKQCLIDVGGVALSQLLSEKIDPYRIGLKIWAYRNDKNYQPLNPDPNMSEEKKAAEAKLKSVAQGLGKVGAKLNKSGKIVFYKEPTPNQIIREYIQNGSRGDLDLSGSLVKTLNGLEKVIGDLNLSNCKHLSSLGNLNRVEGMVDISGCESLKSLDRLGGAIFYLDAENCYSLSSLGSMEILSGSASFRNCRSLTSIGPLRKVKDYLDLTGCVSLESLDGLEYVGKNIKIRNTLLSNKYSIEDLEKMYPSLKGKFEK